jgi:hypothetical protein
MRSHIMRRTHDHAIAPNAQRIYVLEQDQKIPSFACDPALGRTSVEVMFAKDGPVFVQSLNGSGVCQLGYGVVLMVA